MQKPLFLLLILLAPTLSWAQEPVEVAQEPPEFVEIVEVEGPEDRLLSLTLGLYQVVSQGEGDCVSLSVSLKGYLDLHEEELCHAAESLLMLVQGMSEAEVTGLLERFEEVADWPETPVAQDRLGRCLRESEVQGKRRNVEKEMRRFYRCQEALVLHFTGSVD